MTIREKVPLKNILYFRIYKKTNFWQKIFFLLLFTIRNLSILYLLKYNVFFNGTFSHTLLLYIFIYIYNTIIFRDIKVWDFKKFQILKMKRALVLMCTKSPLHENGLYVVCRLSLPSSKGSTCSQESQKPWALYQTTTAHYLFGL
jgi:hypothetical protein